MFGKKNVTPQIENSVAKAANFEVTVADIAQRSERRAWMVAWTAIAMALILAGGYFFFLPLKEKVPYVVMAD
ncbi:MAG: VirB8/TrbF family protein, partial [Lysobacter sp.]